MKNLFELGNEYAKESDWKDLALIKGCLCSIGILIGMQITPKYRKTALFSAVTIFLATYIPLMKKFFRLLWR